MFDRPKPTVSCSANGRRLLLFHPFISECKALYTRGISGSHRGDGENSGVLRCPLRVVGYIQVHTGTYRYIQVHTGTIPQQHGAHIPARQNLHYVRFLNWDILNTLVIRCILHDQLLSRHNVTDLGSA